MLTYHCLLYFLLSCVWTPALPVCFVKPLTLLDPSSHRPANKRFSCCGKNVHPDLCVTSLHHKIKCCILIFTVRFKELIRGKTTLFYIVIIGNVTLRVKIINTKYKSIKYGVLSWIKIPGSISLQLSQTLTWFKMKMMNTLMANYKIWLIIFCTLSTFS